MANILVIDDESDMRLALKNVLSRNGHKVVEAGDGETGLGLLRREAVDLILLDIRLPGMDGVEILRRVREIDRKLPVIMVTGYGSVDSAVQVMQMGASHYLAKPFSNQDLVDTVARTLAGGWEGGQAAEDAGIARRASPEKHVTGGGAKTPVPRAVPSAATTPAARPSPLRALMESSAARRAAAVALVLAAVAVAARTILRRGGADFAVPYSHPSALVWVGDRLWTADWYTGTVYEAELRGGSLAVLRSVALPNRRITGLAVTPDALYLCDGWKRLLEKRRLDSNLTLDKTYPSPGPRPSGLYWDGRYLWSSDSSASRIYQQDPSNDMIVVANYASPGKSPVALFKDEHYFWSADADTRLLYQHRLDTRLRVIAKYHLAELDEGGRPLSAVARRGDEVWLGRDGLSALAERNLASFSVHELAP